MLESEDGLGLADSVGVMLWNYRGVPHNVEILEVNAENLDVLPSSDGDLCGSIIILPFHVVQEKFHLMAVNPEKYALALMEALFTDEEIASSCYCVMKRSKKTPLPMENKVF